MDEWIKAYQQKCTGAKINYQGTGSGAGITASTGSTADFAGSDSALKDGDETTKATARCGGNPALNLPMVIGPIAIAYNLDGVKDLQLKPETLAKIFAGKITKWDDAAIKGDNPSATLPSTAILPVHRSDASGTTENFTSYLARPRPADWTFGQARRGRPPGGQAEKGSDGVAGAAQEDGRARSATSSSRSPRPTRWAWRRSYNGAGESTR